MTESEQEGRNDELAETLERFRDVVRQNERRDSIAESVGRIVFTIREASYQLIDDLGTKAGRGELAHRVLSSVYRGGSVTVGNEDRYVHPEKDRPFDHEKDL